MISSIAYEVTSTHSVLRNSFATPRARVLLLLRHLFKSALDLSSHKPNLTKLQLRQWSAEVAAGVDRVPGAADSDVVDLVEEIAEDRADDFVRNDSFVTTW